MDFLNSPDTSPEQIRVDYIGWLGHGNLGDEALYVSARKCFQNYQLVTGTMPGRVRRPQSGIAMFGGGTVLPYWTLWVKPSRYNYAFGVGVMDPSFWDEVYFDPVFIDRIKRFNFRFLGVRGPISKALLKHWGIESEVVGDPCLLLEPRSYKKRESTIGINIGTDRELNGSWGNSEERVFRQTVKMCVLLKKDGYRMTLIPFCPEEAELTAKVSQRSGVEIFERWADVQAVIDFISSCEVLIGEKLHSIVFSASAHTPFISIEYQPKCLDFTQTVGFEKYSIRTDRMTARNVIAKLNVLLDNWDENHELLVSRVRAYRTKLRESAGKIGKDIESLPEDKRFPPTSSVLEDLRAKIDRRFFFRAPRYWRICSRLKREVLNPTSQWTSDERTLNLHRSSRQK